MRQGQSAPAMLRLLHLPVLALCALLLAGCRFGAPVSLFEEEGAIAQAVDALKQRIGAPVHVLNIVVVPAQVAIRVQDVKNRNRVEEWRVDRLHSVGISWDRVTGPVPHELTLSNPDLEANL